MPQKTEIRLGRILVFEHTAACYSGKSHMAKYGVDLTVKTIETLFVYCDVLDHVVVGDVMAPLLRIVDMKRTPGDGRMHNILKPPLYVRLQKKHFDTVEINIMTDTGEPGPFVHGKSVAILEFKGVGLLEKVI